MDTIDEFWKSVVGYTGMYEVSNFGRIRSVDRVCSDGRRCKGRMLKIAQQPAGYEFVVLSKAAKLKPRNIHRIVLEAFVGPCPHGYETRHKDGVRTNNVLSNLCWGTSSENNFDIRRHGRLKLRAVRRSDGVEFPSIRDAAIAVGGGESCICTVCRGRQKTARGFGWEYVA